MTVSDRNSKAGKRYIALDEDAIPSEKWLVAFKSSRSKRFLRGTLFVRQFYAPGFYEAYDIVATYSEKFQVEIQWFKEKRNCGYTYLCRNYPELESICTYCNGMFNHIDPIPCPETTCLAELCSKECVINHSNIRHKK